MPRIGTLIVGGKDRGYDFSELAEQIATKRIENVIFMQEYERIKDACVSAGVSAKMFHARSMRHAVWIAKVVTRDNRIVLLSPASPSYGMFKSFEEKGDQYKYYLMKKHRMLKVIRWFYQMYLRHTSVEPSPSPIEYYS